MCTRIQGGSASARTPPTGSTTTAQMPKNSRNAPQSAAAHKVARMLSHDPRLLKTLPSRRSCCRARPVQACALPRGSGLRIRRHEAHRQHPLLRTDATHQRQQGAFRMEIRSSRLLVDMHHEAVEYTILAGAPTTIRHYGTDITLDVGQPRLCPVPTPPPRTSPKQLKGRLPDRR
ncbi:glycosyl hydrolase family 65 protein [Streptomyces fagopyri]|uniref:glycosyl hydrolase family 65 protein n=1 Tax=Streptomyces fagopyri TaxID=2662397 RepID=UPI0033FED29B